jgi:transmembrane sensor
MSKRRSDAPVLETPLAGALRDPVAEPQLQRMWHNVKARRSASRAPIRSAFVGALAGVAATVAVMFTMQALRRQEALHARPSAPVAAQPSPLAFGNGAPIRPATALPGNLASFSDGSHVEMAADTRLEPLVASATEVVLRLARGRTLFDVTPGGPRRWTIEAGIASIEVVGTRFVVTRAPDAVRVDVERGVVLVRGTTVPDGVARLEEGQSIEVRAAPAAGASSAMPGVANGRDRVAAGPAWRDSAAHGHYAEAYASLGSGGIGRETTHAARVEDLLALADVARLSGHPVEAVEPLQRILRDHASSQSAPLAAVTLGRVELSLGRPQNAAQALERALALRVPAGLEEDVYARLVEAYAKAENTALAASAARAYRARFPAGRRLADVARWSPQ